jgi:hypothetical protein
MVGLFAVLTPACDEPGCANGLQTGVCLLGCRTQDDCEDGLTCHEVPGTPLALLSCTRACTSSAECHCACGTDGENGFCGAGEIRRENTCFADRPSTPTMCAAACDFWSTCVGTSSAECIEGICDAFIAPFSLNCSAEVDAFLFCAFRLRLESDQCGGEGIYGEPGCADLALAVETCSGERFNPFRPF